MLHVHIIPLIHDVSFDRYLMGGLATRLRHLGFAYRQIISNGSFSSPDILDPTRTDTRNLLLFPFMSLFPLTASVLEGSNL